MRKIEEEEEEKKSIPFKGHMRRGGLHRRLPRLLGAEYRGQTKYSFHSNSANGEGGLGGERQ